MKLKFLHMKLSILFTTTALILSNLSFSQSYTEGADLPGTGTGPAFTVAAPFITIAGTLTTPNDGQDRFQIVVPSNCAIFGVAYSITDQFSLGLTGFAQFGVGNQMTTPPLSGSFTGGPTGPFPVGPGTYDCMMIANIASQDVWQMAFQATCTVGDGQFDFEWNEAKIFPNPVISQCNLSFKAKGNVVVRLTDVQGKLIFEDLRGDLNGPTIFNYDMNNYENGVYFLQLTNGDETSSLKMIKNR